MTTLSAPNMMDLLKVCSRPRQDEVEQYQELTGKDWEVDAVANELYMRQGVKWVILDDDQQPLVVFGADLILPGVWQTWMVGSQKAWDENWKAITRHTRKAMDFMFDQAGARRIQTMALASRSEACKWYEKGLRMTQESIAKGFGVTGQDFACFVKLKEQ